MAAALTPEGRIPKSLAGSMQISPMPAQGETASSRSWLDRLLRRQEPTIFQRCLAVHIHHAGPQSALS
jgi:hypothetical protein